MRCIKTGFHALLSTNATDNGQPLLLHGDAFMLGSPAREAAYPCPYGHERLQEWQIPDRLLLRICSVEPVHGTERIHLQIGEVEHWFDRSHLIETRHNSTMLVQPSQWQWLGYNGVDVAELTEARL